MRLRFAPMILGVLLSGTAWGQLINRNIAEDDLTITFDNEEEFFLNVDNCRSRLNETYTIQGSLVNGVTLGDGELSIFFSREGATCTNDTLDECPATTLDGTCQCLDSSDTASTVSLNEELVDLWPEACETAGIYELRFVLNFYEDYGNDDSDLDQDSAAAKVIIDLDPPSAPSDPPTISPSDGALVVTFPERRGVEEYDYEVCYRLVGTEDEEILGLPDAGGDRFPAVLDAQVESASGGIGAADLPTNDALRGSYSCNCDRKEDDEFRCEGLDNGQDYEVVYAILDEAGNRSESSPRAVGVPGEVLDFAERYSGGETGGCASTRGPGVGLIALAGLGLLITMRRRRH